MLSLEELKFLAVVLLFAGVLKVHPALGADAAKSSPEDFLKGAINDASRQVKDGGAGEDFCWASAWYMGDFVKAYAAWKDPAWLDAGVTFYDFAVGVMNTGPDGYKGWIGPYEYDAKVWADVHVGDAVLLNHMLEFSLLVLNDEALKKKYGEAANRYVALARHDFAEKWDSRGTWHEDGPYGAYTQWDTFCEPAILSSWKKRPDIVPKNTGLSLPFNKQNDAAQCFIKLYRITNEKAYRERAEKIFTFMKSRMLLAGDYYVWNYWEPFGPWDVDLDKKDTLHWMNVHGYRNYQAGEIHQIVEAYNAGIVFDETDIQRIINTNLEVMWNKDKASPKFVNSNALLMQRAMTPEEQKAAEEEAAKNKYAKEGRAGCLWSDLAQFDPTVRELYAAQLRQKESIARAYFENVTLKHPANMARLQAELPVTSFEFPYSECESLTVASVMPQSVSKDKPSVVLCKACLTVDGEIAVYSADGKEKKLVLYQGKIVGGTDGHAGIFILQWDGSDPAGKVKLDKGNYRVRWTVSDGFREFPVLKN